MTSLYSLPGARRFEVTAPDGVRLAAVEAGAADGPTVVLVHGYPDTKEIWTDVAERLADTYRVVAYDVRGAGESSRPEATSAYALHHLADDFEDVLDAVAPEGKVHVVGHDWGSVQAWEFVTTPRIAGRIASFTTISGPSLDHLALVTREGLTRPTPKRVSRNVEQAFRSWYVYALHVPVAPEMAWRGLLGKHWPALLAKGEKTLGAPEPSLPEDAAFGAKLYRANVRHRMANPRGDATTDIPVQLVVPDRDKFLAKRLYDELHRFAPNLTRRQVSGGHWVPRTRPDLLARWIGEFVDRVERDAVPAPAAAKGRKARRDEDNRRRFAGQLAVITGAGSGIGRATALALAEAGARLVLVDRDGASAARTADLAEVLGAVGAYPETVDVSDAEAMEQLAEKVRAAHGVPDLVVNNAGIGIAGSFLDTSPEEWKRTLDVNLWGVIHGCRLFGAMMVERGQGGHIVNTASAAAFQPSKSLPAYSTSKAAVLMLSECLRAEFAAHGIGVTAICPGFVATGITGATRFVGTSSDQERSLREKTTKAYKRRGYPPEKVADAILRAVGRNTAVQPVTPEARAARAASRFTPRVLRALARVDLPK
ncbi:SDR family oxidoreductase [Yinghuangia soli]|uniref:SDR family oxidoreductase n=1 Tax=Yinghuangia soli TaxID=2908204 RepID=A0AA41TZ40_9ACTN|nr:SDR family oxidoreductase [Yinghuangia soli]MCF2527101.1 SDR family oxidoreductase [Yinghuangia soli]